MTPQETVAVLAATAVVLAVFLAVARWVGNRWYAGAGTVALLGHAAFGALVLPRLPYAWDIGRFHYRATLILSGELPPTNPTINSFAGLQAVLYSVFGPDPTVVAVFNGLCAVLVALPAADLARRLYPGLSTTRGLVATVLFLPLPFVFLTIPMRDALGVLLFFSLLAAVARAYDGETWPVVLGIPLWGALSLLRPELGAILLAGGVAGAVVKAIDVVAERPVTLRGLVALAAVPGVVALPFLVPRLPVAPFAERLQRRAVGGAIYLDGFSYETGLDVVLAAPARALYFQYAPFPLHATSAFDVVSALLLPVLIVLTVAAYRSARECERDLAVLVLLLAAYVLGVVGYGLVDTNFGTTVRHRVPFTFLLCVLATPTIERWATLLLGAVGLDIVVDSTPAPERVGD
ncbi:hypothetical protein [Haloglomus litoreum]|uniref:hypothetical protein n=1 Tax=Haloglomus litoreum TaxID=3034026 RepID=UPI0023E80BBF|nr:hypothetical protein [Haloglomus sp. DT116]